MLINQLIGLTIQLAAKFHRGRDGNFDEYVSAGLVGAAEALNYYCSAKGTFKSFASLCIIRRMLDLYRSERRFRRCVGKLAADTDPRAHVVVDVYDPEEPADVERHFKVLSEKERVVFRMRYLRAMEFDEIAHHLHTNLNTIHLRHYKGLNKIRHCVAPNERGTIMVRHGTTAVLPTAARSNPPTT